MENQNKNLQARQTTSLQTFARTEPLENIKTNQISVYKPGKVSSEVFALGCKLIKGSKPKLTDDWYKTLEIMIDRLGFNDEKFQDAIEVMIATCRFPEPSHADILSYDKFIDFYTWEELLENVNYAAAESRKIYLESFVKVVHYSLERFVKKKDAIKYKLELWIKPERILIKEKSIDEETDTENVNMSLGDLVKTFKTPKVKNKIKRFSKEERRNRDRLFEQILENETSSKNKVVVD